MFETTTSDQLAPSRGLSTAGYEKSKLTPSERLLLPAMQRAAAFRFLLSRLWDLYLPRKATLLKPHDPGHFERMLRMLRGEIPMMIAEMAP
ncbi:hypothetical protein P0R31_19100 [Bradyrhizobium yuanmingense]|uniref:hypothetical protein n=1 Tax=Bradyrhizobium yuanmingense TaxID=108015 RepID=UPI0023B90E2F|nr:hypothetical protein [Bradyrhizobium yuanmingense]MDF0519347.1 hypothetical protein [Bradyrhizobium yuanmingense]